MNVYELVMYNNNNLWNWSTIYMAHIEGSRVQIGFSLIFEKEWQNIEYVILKMLQTVIKKRFTSNNLPDIRYQPFW